MTNFVLYNFIESVMFAYCMLTSLVVPKISCDCYAIALACPTLLIDIGFLAQVS